MSTEYDGILDRINTYMLINGVTRTKLANRLGLDRSTVNSWFTGRTKSYTKYINEIAQIIGASSLFLLAGGDSNHSSSSNKNFGASNLMPLPETKKVPLLGEIACGEPILAIENIMDFVTVPSSIHADMALVCKGDSMINARIFDGDVVYIRQQEDVENGEIAAVLIGDEATLKRVYKSDSKIVLSAANPNYSDMVYINGDAANVRIIGKAVAFTSAVR